MLLHHQKGCQSFNSIKTVHEELCPTYRAACEKLGLLENDHEWSVIFNEAAGWATAGYFSTLTADRSTGSGKETVFAQSETVELDVDNSATEKSDVKDIEVNKSGAANDDVLSESDDLLIAVSSSTTLDNQSSGPVNGAIIEQSGKVDNAATEQIVKSDVKDIEVNFPPASDNLLISVSSSSTLTDDRSADAEIPGDWTVSTSGDGDETAPGDETECFW